MNVFENLSSRKYVTFRRIFTLFRLFGKAAFGIYYHLCLLLSAVSKLILKSNRRRKHRQNHKKNIQCLFYVPIQGIQNMILFSVEVHRKWKT